jgi:hypothetical protein
MGTCEVLSRCLEGQEDRLKDLHDKLTFCLWVMLGGEESDKLS